MFWECFKQDEAAWGGPRYWACGRVGRSLWFFGYPATAAGGDLAAIGNLDCHHLFAPAPSEDLRGLIEAGAPCHIVADKLAEEYPEIWLDAPALLVGASS